MGGSFKLFWASHQSFQADAYSDGFRPPIPIDSAH